MHVSQSVPIRPRMLISFYGFCFHSQLYRSSSFNSSGRSSTCDTTDDMYSDASLEEDVQDLQKKVSAPYRYSNKKEIRKFNLSALYYGTFLNIFIIIINRLYLNIRNKKKVNKFILELRVCKFTTF